MKKKIKKIILSSIVIVTVVLIASLLIAGRNSMITGSIAGLLVGMIPVFIFSVSLESMKKQMINKSTSGKAFVYALSALIRLTVPVLFCMGIIFYLHLNGLGLIIGITIGTVFSTVLLIFFIRSIVIPEMETVSDHTMIKDI